MSAVRADSVAGQAGVSERVLVVDDEERLRRSLTLALSLCGFRTSMAGNGLEALEFMASGPVDVVVTDLFMPDMDGVQVITEVRRRWPGVLVIAISGGGAYPGGEEILWLASQAGADRVLSKPVTAEQLADAIRELTAQGRATA